MGTWDESSSPPPPLPPCVRVCWLIPHPSCSLEETSEDIPCTLTLLCHCRHSPLIALRPHICSSSVSLPTKRITLLALPALFFPSPFIPLLCSFPLALSIKTTKGGFSLSPFSFLCRCTFSSWRSHLSPLCLLFSFFCFLFPRLSPFCCHPVHVSLLSWRKR